MWLFQTRWHVKLAWKTWHNTARHVWKHEPSSRMALPLFWHWLCTCYSRQYIYVLHLLWLYDQHVVVSCQWYQAPILTYFSFVSTRLGQQQHLRLLGGMQMKRNERLVKSEKGDQNDLEIHAHVSHACWCVWMDEMLLFLQHLNR